MSTRLDKQGCIERLWTAPDGTVCLLAISAQPPMYSISMVRGAQVLRERTFYGRATAQMMAQGWGEGDGTNG
jgi:hypothetical protein